MYDSIYVPVDNSEHSNRAMEVAVELGRSFTSRLVGCHVYAARMHDYRFKQMEFTLPEEYLVESELARQRKIHDSLITMGLELISDCYLNTLEERCAEAGLPFERRMMDGKHAPEIVRDVQDSDYDLVVMGVLGIGRSKDSQIGSVCARVTREIERDVWVVKHLPGKDDGPRDTVMVGVDGSPESFGALATGIELAKRFGKKLDLVGVYDPYLHYAVFKGIVEVLTDKAAKVFRFEEQNQLHEEIIDTGLAEIYQSHVNVAARMAEEEGVEVTRTLLDGKAFQKILDHARQSQPWVMVVGRLGIHKSDGDSLGSNTENLLRLAPCDLLLTTRTLVPELDLKAEESIHWTPEAEERMTRVPEQVKGIARTAILRLALEKGHSVVSSDLVTEAMERFMPKRSAQLTEQLAEALAYDKARREPVSVCAACGTAARTPDPVRCTVCGGERFEVLTPETLDVIAAAEGGVEEETTYDGRKVRWTKESRRALEGIGDNYQRRRAKARIEKQARMQGLDPIPLAFAQRIVEEETGVRYDPASVAKEPDAVDEDPKPAAESGDGDGRHLVARDAKGNPLLSTFDYTAEAAERLLRVPAGFMRDRTQGRVEALAAERGLASVDLATVEDGIDIGRRMMAEMLGEVGGVEGAQEAAAAGECPVDEADAGGPAPAERKEADSSHPPLNEVSVMTELDKRRREMMGEG